MERYSVFIQPIFGNSTYQSDKYTQTTAVSNKIVVTANVANEFEVKQDTLTKFTVNFDHAVKTLGDVTITRLYNNGSISYEYPVVVKEAKLAADGKSATVEVYTNFADKTNYVISIDGFDAYTMIASAGAPVSMTISSSETDLSVFVTGDGNEHKLYAKLYDVNGVDVSKAYKADERVSFETKEYSTDGSYYVADGKIYFSKAELFALVTGTYHSGEFDENGVEKNTVTKEETFVSVAKEQVTIQKIEYTLLDEKGNDLKTLAVPQDAVASLQVKITTSDKNETTIKKDDGTTVANVGKISFEETTPNVLVLDGDLRLHMFNAKSAVVVINATNTDDNGKSTTVPIGAVTITVKAATTLNTAKADKTSVIVGVEEGGSLKLDEETIKITAEDQYGSAYQLAGIAVEGTTDNAKKATAGITSVIDGDGNGKITVDGSAMGELLGEGWTSNAIQLTFKATVTDANNAKKEINFTVLLKKATGDESVKLEASSSISDIARTSASKDAKSVTYTLYTMKNGVKVGTKNVETYPSDVKKDAKKDTYYVKVTKNGTDITNKVVTGGAITINFSETKNIEGGVYKADGSVVSGSAITYNMGAGTYTIALYKSYSNGTVTPYQTVSVIATCNTGSYGAAVRVNETIACVDKTDATEAEIRACFKVNNTKGEEATAPYRVSFTQVGEYVYVKSITFYDEVADGVYAPYKVNVGVALKTSVK